MKVKGYNFQSFMHGTDHVDVEITFPNGHLVKLCNVTTYLGGADSFGDPRTFAAQMRHDLENLFGSGEELIVKRDSTDGSIDLFRKSDGALMFSATAEHVEGADWIPVY